MFNTEIKVRFNHVDAAGIVFYPRFYEMFNQVVEEWFEQKLGLDFAQLESEFSAGVPTVSIQAEFPSPSRLGDYLAFELSVVDVGNSSITLTIAARVDQQIRATAKMVLIYVHRHTDGSIEATRIPTKLRASILAN